MTTLNLKNDTAKLIKVKVEVLPQPLDDSFNTLMDEAHKQQRAALAAPEMLEALQMVVVLASSDTASAKARIAKMGSIARAAIAKAKDM
jgi:hypothetical protein